jgi:putative DNA primase/helicase
VTGEAVRLAEAGFNIFPCHTIPDPFAGECSCGDPGCGSPGKHPLTKHGCRDATAQRMRVEAWWRAWPDANIGIATGNVYVIDCDGDEGITAWKALEDAHTPAPTLTARTGGGGLHLYFQPPAGIRLGNTAGRLASHIDTRGDGGYVLAPPSSHSSGRSYEWAEKRPISYLPGWVISLLQPKRLRPTNGAKPKINFGRSSRYALAALDEELRRVESAPEGQRNQTLAAAAWSLGQLVGAGALDPHGIATLLVESCPDPDVGKSMDTVVRQLREGAQCPRQVPARSA